MREKFPIRKEKIRHVLIRGTNWVGDAVMSLPAVAAVRQNFSKARITLLVRPWVRGLYSYCPDIDAIMTFDQRAGFFVSRCRVIKELRKQHFDLAILFQNAFDAALVTFLAGIPCRVGYNTDTRSWLLTHSVILSKEILEVHQVHYYLGLLGSLGWKPEGRTPGCKLAGPDPCLVIPAEKKDRADQYLTKKGVGEKDLLLGFNPGAFFGPAKRWSPERYAAVADKAARQFGVKNIIFGSVKDVPVAREMAAQMRSTPILAAGETSLEELVALISRCSLFVTNDSGPMHIAAAVGTPVLAVFGSTDPATTSPYGHEHTIVYHQVSCGPCLRRICPKDHRCMKSVTVEEVWQAVENKIRQDLQDSQDKVRIL